MNTDQAPAMVCMQGQATVQTEDPAKVVSEMVAHFINRYRADGNGFVNKHMSTPDDDETVTVTASHHKGVVFFTVATS